MTIQLNGTLIEQAKVIPASSIIALASTDGDCKYVSMKNYRRCTVIINILNGNTVTATDIALKQATAVAGTSEKALSFTTYHKNIDVGADADNFASATAASDTFATDTTNGKRLVYVIEVDSEDLDVANGFDCFRVEAANAANSTGFVQYVLWGARYSGADPTVD